MITIKKSKNGQFYFTVFAANGRKLCHSENYSRKENCLGAIESLTGVMNYAMVKDLTKKKK